MAWNKGLQSNTIDFYQPWLAATVVNEPGIESIYYSRFWGPLGREFHRRAVAENTSQRQVMAAAYRSQLELYGTPFFYASLSPLPRNYERAFRIFLILSLAAIALLFLLAGRKCGHSAVSLTLLATTVLVSFEPLDSELRVAGVNMLQLGALTIYIAARTSRHRSIRGYLAAALLALIICFKPNLAAIAPLLIVHCWRQEGQAGALRTLAGMSAGFAINLAATSLYFGSWTVWLDWYAVISSLPSAIVPLSIGNFSLTAAAHLPRWWGLLVALSATCGFAYLLARQGRRPAAWRSEIFAAGAGILVTLLASPLVWVHYFLLTLLLFIPILAPPALSEGQPIRRLWYWALFAFALIAMRPWLFLTTSLSVAVDAALVNAGLLLLTLLLIIHLYRGMGPMMSSAPERSAVE